MWTQLKYSFHTLSRTAASNSTHMYLPTGQNKSQFYSGSTCASTMDRHIQRGGGGRI